MEYIYSAMDMIGDFFLHLWVFINHIPDFIRQSITYLILQIGIFYYEFQIFMLDIAVEIARKILSEYGIYDIVELSFNRLPPDLRFILSAYGVPDAFRIIFDVYAASFILRFVGK